MAFYTLLLYTRTIKNITCAYLPHSLITVTDDGGVYIHRIGARRTYLHTAISGKETIQQRNLWSRRHVYF